MKYFLEQCLYSVGKAIQQLEAEVWVVDNASSDDSLAYLQPKFPWVKFIKNAQNVGFAKANNQALLRCAGKYVLFLNPDTIIPEDSLARSIAFVEKNEQAGALGIRMIDGSGAFLPESKRSLPSPVSSLFKLSGLSRMFPESKFFSRYSLTYLNEFENHEVEVLSGAFMLVKRNLLSELKGFDESFFMYGEDIDLSYRIQKLGFKNHYFSDCTIIHFKGESTKKTRPAYVKMFYKAMSIFVRKHYASQSSYWTAFFLHFSIGLIASLLVAAQAGYKAVVYVKCRVKNFFGAKKRKPDFAKQCKIIVAGSAEDYEEVKNLLVKSASPDKIDDGALIQIEDIDEAAKVIANSKANEIIFCAGHLTHSYIIDKMQHLPKSISLRFHCKGSGSIVGSDSKNTTGEVISGFEKENNI